MPSRPLLANDYFRKERLSISIFLIPTGLENLWPVRDGPFNFQGAGVMVFVQKNILNPNVAEKKILVEKKKYSDSKF